MINKITLFVSIITILLVHISVLFMYKTDSKKIIISEKPTITSISVRKVVEFGTSSKYF